MLVPAVPWSEPAMTPSFQRRVSGHQLSVLEEVKFLQRCSQVNFTVGQAFRDRVLVAVVGDEAVFVDPAAQGDHGNVGVHRQGFQVRPLLTLGISPVVP